jgi:hypothetical protein
MSDKIKEFVEIPQQFVRDGKQVLSALDIFFKRSYGSLAVHNPVHKTISDGFVFTLNVVTAMLLKPALCCQSSLLYAGRWELGSR